MKKFVPLLICITLFAACAKKETAIVHEVAEKVAFLKESLNPEDLYFHEIPMLARIPNPKWPGCTLEQDRNDPTIVCPDSSFEFGFTSILPSDFVVAIPAIAIRGRSTKLPDFMYVTYISATEAVVPDSCWVKQFDFTQRKACKNIGGKSGGGSTWTTVAYNVDRKYKPLIAPKGRDAFYSFTDYRKNLEKEWGIKR